MCNDVESVFRLMDELDKKVADGIFASMEIPQNSIYHKFNIREHTAHAVLSVTNQDELKWAALLHDIGKVKTITTDSGGINHFYGHPEVSAIIAKEILTKLNCEDRKMKYIANLIALHDKFNDSSKPIKMKHVRELVGTHGNHFAHDLVQLKLADIKAQSELSYQLKINMMLELDRLINIVNIDGTGVDRYGLDIDLDKVTDQYGEYTDDIINVLLKNVWGNPDTNERSSLLKIANKEYKRMILRDMK